MQIVYRVSVAIAFKLRCQLTSFLDTPIFPPYKPSKDISLGCFSYGGSKWATKTRTHHSRDRKIWIEISSLVSSIWQARHFVCGMMYCGICVGDKLNLGRGGWAYRRTTTPTSHPPATLTIFQKTELLLRESHNQSQVWYECNIPGET